MSIWESMFLGFLQGVTEFLPVSSSGHLVVARRFLGVELPGVQFEVALHLATLVSVLAVYRESIMSLFCGLLDRDDSAFEYLLMLSVATVPAGLLGVWGSGMLEDLFVNPWVPVIGFFVTGLVLWNFDAKFSEMSRGRVTLVVALMIGLAQACALVPGISRSGMTVAMALWLGVNDEEALRFSFLASIPIILGATSIELIDLQSENISLDGMDLFVGMLVAGITGIFAIKSFLFLLRRKMMTRFALYCFSLSFCLGLVLLGTGTN